DGEEVVAPRRAEIERAAAAGAEQLPGGAEIVAVVGRRRVGDGRGPEPQCTALAGQADEAPVAQHEQLERAVAGAGNGVLAYGACGDAAGLVRLEDRQARLGGRCRGIDRSDVDGTAVRRHGEAGRAAGERRTRLDRMVGEADLVERADVVA